MSYIINNSRGQVVTVVADGTINTTSTSLALVGRGVNGYGESENENYMYLLENFASSTAPDNPVEGQLWFNTATNQLAFYNMSQIWETIPTEAYVQAQKNSPVFTGTPTAPTAAPGTANTQIATTAFVTNSPQFAGVPTAPTASIGTATTQIATTAFVTNSPQFAGEPTAPTPLPTDNSNVLATTSFVQAQKNSPDFTGTPTAPTAFRGTATTQIATTAFVTVSPQFTGSPTGPTAGPGTANTQLATTAFVTNSPQFAGVPTAPTAPLGTANLQIASTEFVQDTVEALGEFGTLARQNANAVSITGGTITGITALPVSAGGTGGGNPSQARTNLGLGSLSLQSAANVQITGGQITGITPLELFSGGTGASNASGARANLGIGSLALQDAGQVNITGGNIAGITDLAIADGGTGASSALDARTNLGLGTLATQNISSVNITGGNISGVILQDMLLPLGITSGGTGAVSAGGARSNLGLGDMAVQNSTNVNITGGTITGVGPIPITSGGTGTNNVDQAMRNLLPNQAGQATKVLSTNGSTLLWVPQNENAGTVTQVSGSGFANGLYLAGTVTSSGNIILGGEITNVSATAISRDIIDPARLASGTANASVYLRGDSTWSSLGPLANTAVAPIANGGTGGITRQAALNNLLPSQTGNTNHYLVTNGTDVSWQPLPDTNINSIVPSQTGNAGRYLTTNGTTVSWGALGAAAAFNTVPIANGGTGATTASAAINALVPSQSGLNGYLLGTNGSTVGWVTLPAAYSTVTYGTINTYSYTNIVGGFSDAANYFDVFPPAGKTMSQLAAFLPSIAYIYFAGGVDGNDALRCVWTALGDRVRVYVQNTEQRYFPAANYLAFWR